MSHTVDPPETDDVDPPEPDDVGHVTVFDVCGPLPTGTTVLEASAGTGKTFTIAALATRYVAEGVATLPQLLLVTFGRAATSELRDRVRGRLVQTQRALSAADPTSSPDRLVRHLAAVDADELGRRRDRLTAALAQFDAATIATTHGFCQQMLVRLGTAADVDVDAVLVPDLADLVDEVLDDVYLRRYADCRQPPLTVALARELARAAVGDPHARLEPAGAPSGTFAAERIGLAREVRAEVDRRKRERRLLDYDDLLSRLRDALTDPEHGAHARQRIRATYAVVLVDEFQDTDPVQWQILRSAFHGHRTLVLIGDPKQAIYAFRGGDVVTYLAAAADADHTATLARSWRSDRPLVTGLQTLLRGTALGDPRIAVRPMTAEHEGRRHDGFGPPVRIRQVTRAAWGAGRRLPSVAAVRTLIVADVVADIVRQLDQGRLLEAGRWRPVEPGDIAVLARRNADVAAVREALVAAGVPAVSSTQASVFASASARSWQTLLAALERPGHAGRAAAAALTPFIGWDATGLATASDAERDELSDRIRRWARILAERGVAALLEAATAGGLLERLLRTTTGERTFTDLRHVGQVLHHAAVTEGLGVAALTEWLGRRVREAGEDYAEERSRRLETDAAAVQVVTVHASKGLEFPVVHVPFAWDRYEPDSPDLLTFHEADDQRVRHLGGQGSPGYDEARAQHLAEDRGESLRLLYVAVTRACSQVVLWWAPSKNSPTGPLTRLLLGGTGPGQEPSPSVSLPRDDDVAAALAALAATSNGSVAVETVDRSVTPVRRSPPAPQRPALHVAAFTRRLDLSWRRTSYTRLTAPAHQEQRPRTGGEPEIHSLDDEGGADPWTPAQALISPLTDLPTGSAFGTLVHTVLEAVDTSAPDLGDELHRCCTDAGADRFPGVGARRLADALGPVLATPLGPLAADLALADIPSRDRLAELEFELPLAGGDAPVPAGTVARIAALLTEHLSEDDPFLPYALRLRTAPFAATRLDGYLTGSLDAVLRLRHRSGEPRYLVVDYKTNRLGPPDAPVTAWHYRPEALVEAMTQADYPLQLLLYLVALHRYLRWRQPGHQPDQHLGGGLLLFVRGMCGPDTPVLDGAPAGVLGWRPPGALVVALSRLLDGSKP